MMKRPVRWAALWMLGGVLGCKTVEVETAPASLYTGRAYTRTAACYLESDALTRRDFERALRDALWRYQAKPEPCSDLISRLPSPSGPALKSQLNSSGIDSLLLIETRPMIQLESKAVGSRKGPALDSALNAYVAGPAPTTPEMLALESVTAPTGRNRIEQDVVRGTMRVFDMGSGALVWQTDVHVKAAVDMKTKDRHVRVAEAAAKRLSQHRVIPAAP